MNQIMGDTDANVFEQIKKTVDGTECWEARELMVIAGYKAWRDFNTAIDRAIIAFTTNGGDVEKHFLRISAKSPTGRPGLDYLLTRTACYYIFQNGDSSKPEIAGAQAYFIKQTRLQELNDQAQLESRRVNLHGKVLASEESLGSFARLHHNARNVKRIHDAGNEGLYNMSVDQVEYLKGIEPGRLYDYIDSPELAAHYFRITQTEVQLENDAFEGYTYDQEGLENVAKGVGVSVRSVMRENGRTLPEDLPTVEDIYPIIERLDTEGSGSKKIQNGSAKKKPGKNAGDAQASLFETSD